MTHYWVEDSCQIQSLPDILLSVFGEKNNGTFVEVGAYDGRTYSNTYGLARIGWRGLYIEGIKEFYERCVGNHKLHARIACINAFVSDHVGTRAVYRFGECYTIDHAFAMIRDWNVQPEFFASILPLGDILKEHNVLPGFDLLVTDTDGNDFTILNGFDTDYWMPKMIIAEAHEDHEENLFDMYAADINSLMDSRGYTKIYTDHINNIYVRL